MRSGERSLIDWLRARARGAGGERIGDDAAAFPALDGPWVATVDTQVAGVHYPTGLDPRQVARRLLAVNLSDLAAMGARPRFALLALASPAGYPYRAFFTALLAACRHHAVELIGGDLSTCDPPLAALTLLGERQPAGRLLRRADARPGDRLWVGGSLGESAAGRFLLAAGAAPTVRGGALPPGFPDDDPRLVRAARRALSRHLAPRPQLGLGAWLATQPRAAAIDLSDGLAIDLARLAQESKVGASLDAAALPASPRLVELARWLQKDPLDLMLGGGEDYVLLFALPATVEPPRELGCRPIGRTTRRRALTLQTAQGEAALEPTGWDHLANRRETAPLSFA